MIGRERLSMDLVILNTKFSGVYFEWSAGGMISSITDEGCCIAGGIDNGFPV